MKPWRYMLWVNVNFRVGRYVLDYLPIWWYWTIKKIFPHDLHIYLIICMKRFAQFIFLNVLHHLVRLVRKINALRIVLSKCDCLNDLKHFLKVLVRVKVFFSQEKPLTSNTAYNVYGIGVLRMTLKTMLWVSWTLDFYFEQLSTQFRPGIKL